VIANWLGAVRMRGVRLPIFVGLPGAVDPVRLARISVKVGLGDSMRFLRKQSGVVQRMVTRYTPDELIDGLADCLTDPWYGVAGWHLFTFNEIERTERWRQELVATTRGAAL
jgi:methylenetetrahydrofolate reductase (NADPH)